MFCFQMSGGDLEVQASCVAAGLTEELHLWLDVLFGGGGGSGGGSKLPN